ncbi:hypothetical protein K402DRAFT_296647, partial [Aulographum hederae CBS 113979]
GSGPYPAGHSTAPDLPDHTIYAPLKAPPGVKMPVIVWGNGACSADGLFFASLLKNIASHGHIVIVSGAPNATGTSSYTGQIEAMDWAEKNAGKGVLAGADFSKLAAAGQSCGGLQSYSSSLDRRVKLTMIFNSGVLVAENRGKLEQLHAPVVYFLGGPRDIAHANGVADYEAMPAKIPTVRSILTSVGHMATYNQQYGGAFGEAAVAMLKWQFGGDAAAKQSFLQPASGAFQRQGWNITSKN